MTNTQTILKRITITALSVLLMTLGFSVEEAQAAKRSRNRYVPIELISGSNSNLEFNINTKSQVLDLNKTRNLRFKFRFRDIYNTVESQGSIRVDAYEIDSTTGERTYVSTQSLTVNRGSNKRNNRIISIDAGEFVADSKLLEFELHDTANNLVNTYRTEIMATNLNSQVANSVSNTVDVDCSSNPGFGECQIEKFFQHVTFETRKSRQAATRVVNEGNGFYKVQIPVSRKGFRFLRGNRVNRGGSNLNTEDNGSGGSGAIASSFGETLDITRIRLGDDISNFANFGYDPTNDVFILGHGEQGNLLHNNFYFKDSGKLGIGVEDPNAYIHVRAGTGDTAQIQLDPGLLVTTPVNGSIEFDGNELYFTKNGVRSPLGSNATTNNSTINDATINNSTLNGTTIVNGNIEGDLNVNGNVTAKKFIGDGSMLTGVIASGVSNGAINNTAITNVTIDNGNLSNTNLTNVAIDDSTINNTDLTNITVDNGSVNNSDIDNSKITNSDIIDNNIYNNTVNGTLTFLDNAKIEGDLHVNGEVFADKFNGDGSGLTNVHADTATNATNADNATRALTAGLADNATNAANALSAANADNATTANYADIAGSVTGGNVTNVTVENGDINNSDIDNSKITNSDLIDNTIYNNTVNGTLTFLDDAKIDGDLHVDGDVYADNFIGDGSNLTNIKASEVNGTVARAQNSVNATNSDDALRAINAQNATTANYADESGSMNSGTINSSNINNSVIEGGIINGATLTNVNTDTLDIKLSKLVSPDGSVDPAVSIDNSGNATFHNKATANNYTAKTYNTTPSAAMTISSTGVTNVSHSILRIQGDVATTDITAAYQISTTGLEDGFHLIIKGMSDTNKVLFESDAHMKLAAGAPFFLGEHDTLTVYYDSLADAWIELSRSDNI